MANTILAVETSNTFNQWRIVTNSLVSAANEMRNNTYIKDSGGIQLVNGSIQVVNGAVQLDRSTGLSLYVQANATVAGLLTVGTVSGNISSPQANVVTLNVTGKSTFSNAITVSMTNDLDALKITQIGTGNVIVFQDETNPDSTPFIVDNTGKVISGHTDSVGGSVTLFGSYLPSLFQINGFVPLSLGSWSNTVLGSIQQFLKANSADTGTHGLVKDGDSLGSIYFSGSNGTNFLMGSSISSEIDGTASATEMPTQLSFSTRPVGGSLALRRMTIANTGNVMIGILGNPTSTLTVTGDANISDQLIVSGYNVLNEIFQADNNVRVSANSGSTQSAVSLNFINTSSVLVSVRAGTTGNANVGFSAIAGTTSIAGIVQLTDSVTSTSTTTAATPNNVRTVNSIATSAYGQANLAYAQANTANSIAISAYGQANAAYTQANTARTEASAAANGVRVSQNYGSTVLGTGGINFSNTANIKISVTSGISGNANVSFDFPSTIASMSIGALSVTTLTTTNPIIGPTETDSSFYRLRVSQTTRGNGTFGVNQGGANGNAEIKFASSSGIWQITSNNLTGTYYNIISSQNVSDSVTTTSSSNVASSTAAKSAFDQATAAFARANTANSTAVSAYGQANTANSIAVSAYGQANLAYAQANTANSIAISAYGQANAAYTTANNAANTVRVTANSLFAQSAVSLNFVNTPTVRVSVGAGSAGTANIAHTVIPTFTTEVNTTSTLSVTGDATLSSNLNVGGIANLGSIVSKTLDVAKIISNSTSIYNTTRISGIKPESLVYTGKYVNITSFDSIPTGIDFKPDGTKMFLSGQLNKKISQFSLSVPWDSSTATYVSQSAALTTIESQPRGIAFSSDGANVYVQGAIVGNVTQYSLSTAWDVAALTVASNVASYNVATALVALGGLQSALRGLAFSDDGVFMYSSQSAGTGTTPKIFQYRLSTAWNVATASLTSNSGTSTSGSGLVNSTGSYVWQAAELNFINGGSVLQVMNALDSVVHFYALDTPFDITRTKFLGKTPSIIETLPYGSFLSPDGKYLNVVGTTDDNVYTFIANSTTSLGISGDTIAYGDVDVYGSLMVNDYDVLSQIVLGRNQANTANSIAISAYGQANAAYAAANIGLNKAQVSADGGSVQSNVGINFNNTSTVLVSVGPGTTGNANVTFSVIPKFTTEINTTSSLSVTGNATFSNSVTISMSNDFNALRINQSGTNGNAIVIEDSTNPDSTPFVIDSTGKVIIGHTAGVSGVSYIAALQLQGYGTSGVPVQGSKIQTMHWGGDAVDSGQIDLYKSGALAPNTIGTHVLVSNNNRLGALRFYGSNGTLFAQGTSIASYVDGVASATSMPGRIEFSTTPAGSTTGVERMRIANNGNIGIGNSAPNHTLSVSGNTFVSGAAIFTGTVVGSPVDIVSASTSYSENAAGKTIVMNGATSITLTFGPAAYSGFTVDIIRKGTGNVTIANTSLIAKLNVASAQPMSNISSRYATARVTYTATNEFILTGSIQA